MPLGKDVGILAIATKAENLSGKDCWRGSDSEILLGSDNDSLNNVGTEKLYTDNDCSGRSLKRLSNLKATSDQESNHAFE